MLTSLKDRTKALVLTSRLRYLELFFVSCIVLYAILGIYFSAVCEQSNVQECYPQLLGPNVYTPIVQVGIIGSSLLSLLQVRFNFELFDEDPRSDKYFKLSLIGLTVALTLSAIFIDTLSTYGGTGLGQGPYLIVLLLFITSTIALLRDKHSWEQSSHFVKTRLTFWILAQVALLINPSAAVIVGAFTILPIVALVPFKPKAVKTV